MANTPATHILPGLHTVAACYDVLLCDIWGVVHNGQAAYGEACAALTQFRQGGGTVVLITNAPRPRGAIVEQLHRLLVPTTAYDGIVTSGDVTLAYIAARGEAPLHHIGPARDLVLFDVLADQTGLTPPRVTLEAADYVVCTGLYGDDVGTPDDYAAEFALMRQRNLDFISANPDIIVHVGEREIFCAGALAQAYADLGGRVLQAGKPHPPIYKAALEIVQSVRGGHVDPARVLAIGDAMHTDVAGAKAAGVDMLFVTGGIHREALHPRGADGAPTALQAETLAAFLTTQEAQPAYAMPKLTW